MSAALAINANAQASAAQIDANAAHTAACQSLLSNYKTAHVTVPEMQAYADCVDFLYPRHTAAEMHAYAVGVFASICVGAAVGIYVGIRENDAFTGGMCGFMVAAFGAAMALVVGAFLYTYL